MEEQTGQMITKAGMDIQKIEIQNKMIDTLPSFDSSDSFDSIVKEMAKSIDEIKKMETYYRDRGDFDRVLKITKSKMGSLKELIGLIDLRKKLYGTRSVDLDALEFKVMGQYFIETLKKSFEEFCHTNSIPVEANFTKQFLDHFSVNLQGWQSEVYKRIENVRAE